jgi:Haem-binding domain
VFRELLSARARLFARAAALSVCVGLLALAVYRPSETGPPENSEEWSANLAMNSRTAAIFSHSCADCHSNRTRWPWYSYVPPASWLIKHDVDRARKDFNASLWSSYSRETKRELLEDIARVVTNREMPVRQYLLLHKGARLSDGEGGSLVEWARGQRRLLRKASPKESTLESLRGAAAR